MSSAAALPNPVLTGLRGRCPRCAQGKLFSGFLKLAPRCEHCGLDFDFADPADGPAFFAMSVMSFPVLGFALWYDSAYQPPWWGHLLVSLPMLLALCVLPLRPIKGWLVCSQYFYKAEQGRLAPQERPEAAPPGTAPTAPPAEKV
ncbi:hypothetical protein GCM10007036_03590 [Alsobacter metallidurans]|uniref:DUF983 domain-containing protein n=1 Tax=Alsobacter metallidurans TaxID=340221 RepID=A0A917I4M5_9HYPH|nr:DUF983 domain-containing protein [Alsobacter metallidurans]GGH08228.1 hypothetical protein GCM10007036_03590 [Alsobacter metallidurans]